MKKEFWELSFAEKGFDFSNWISFVKELENLDQEGGEVKILKSNLIQMSGNNWAKFEARFIDILTELGYTISLDNNDPVLYGDIITFKKATNGKEN